MQIDRDQIDPDADKVVRRLAQSGYQAYLVGGCVRDLLLNRSPKDFDVSSSATPNEIKSLFRNCRIIGRRFRLAHIFFGSKIIETSTFRANPRARATGDEADLLIHRDNVWGTDTEDAQRRDFTINGLFYDVERELVIDHVRGLADLERRLIRTIGDPDVRFREDPVRMLRAIKFAARLGFEIEDDTYRAIIRHRAEITKCSQPRVIEELYRLLRGGAARRSIELLAQTGLANALSHQLASLFRGPSEAALERLHSASDDDSDWSSTWEGSGEEESEEEELLPLPELSFVDAEELECRVDDAWNLLGQVDRLVAEERPTSNSLVLSASLAAFLMPELLDPALRPSDATALIEELLLPIIKELNIARRDAERTRQILLAQRRLAPSKRRRGKPVALVKRDYFEEALTLYEIIAASRGEQADELEYWRQLQSKESGGKSEDQRRRRRRGGRRRRRHGGNSAVG